VKKVGQKIAITARIQRPKVHTAILFYNSINTINNGAIGMLPQETAKNRINDLHRSIIGTVRKTLNDAIEAGRLLSDVKANLKHGEFVGWIEKNLDFDIRTAQRYMFAYKHRDEIQKNDSVSYLSDAYKIVNENIKDERLQKHKKQKEKIEYAKAHPEEVPIGQVRRILAGAGNWKCVQTITGEFNGLPIKCFECVDPDYLKLKEGAADSTIYWDLRAAITEIAGAMNSTGKCIKKYNGELDSSYWVDFNSGVRKSSPELKAALNDLHTFLKQWHKEHAEALLKFDPPEKGDYPGPGWSTWGSEA
jgi:hypothetical protein